MTKKGKKRRRQGVERIDLLCNVAQYEGSTLEAETMENCLAELETTQSLVDPAAVAAAEVDRAATDPRTNSLWNPPSKRRHESVSMSHKQWKNAFRSYLETGTCRDWQLPSVQVEISRHCAVERLSSELLKKCRNLRMPAFERWWIDSKWEERAALLNNHDNKEDPVIPAHPSPSSPASQRLVQEIIESTTTDSTEIKQEQTEQLVADLCRDTARAAQEIEQLARRCSQNPLGKQGDRIKSSLSSSNHCRTLSYHRAKWKKPYSVKLNESHYVKLQDMFRQVHADVGALMWSRRASRALDVLVLVLLLRYSSLSGGQLLHQQLRGGGMQGAIHSEVLNVLQETFPSLEMECFASPFNAYLSHYASAFASDVDWHFGSIGEFMECSFVEGCYQANPPFSPGLMSAMVERMEVSLEIANQSGKCLTFVVIVPTASDKSAHKKGTAIVKNFAAESFRLILSSVHCRLHVVLPAREHGYVEGAQHLRPTRYKQSAYDTSVIILQSEQAARQSSSLDKPEFERKIQESFASRHEDELCKRRAETKN